MEAGLEDAWKMAGHVPEDPGLRETFEQLPRAPIRLLVGPLNKDINQGGLLRIGEAFRIERIDFNPERDGAVDMSGHRGTKHRLNWRWIELDQALAEAIKDGYHPVALSLTERAVSFDRFDWPFPLALVVGAELDGVPVEIEARCEATVAIPLYGLVQSLNVACATGIVLQNAVSQYARSHPDFTPARRASQRLL
ncbi:tRNA/rRNA methyltransferase (SpoU) [Fimbriimonas ginsengisoli Gsoil 348]|uniref:tRNA/rRNA methyltransferase (SpoU) n=2 Tax=Fimbriimonas ginsengisoli TaxID=1005039 RepID=A0A068NW42_FIMGI|nr:tRNA/rRNA methyltransferase (SpoU) [Fimbriimonas ginsengisoli Gsoil 348]